MSARLCLTVLLLSYFLTQGSTAFTAGFGVGNANGGSSYQVNTISSDSVSYSSSFMGSAMDGWLTGGSSASGYGYIDQTTSYSTSGGSSATNHVHADDAAININDQGTTIGDVVAAVPNIDMQGNTVSYDCTTRSNHGSSEVSNSVSGSGNVNFGGSLIATGSGSGINTVQEGPQTIVNASTERYKYNGYGYADLKLRVDNGSLTLEPESLVGDELVSWHVIGSGSLAEMFIQAMNIAGPYASIHAASSEFMEAYPSASVTYNGAEVKA